MGPNICLASILCHSPPRARASLPPQCKYQHQLQLQLGDTYSSFPSCHLARKQAHKNETPLATALFVPSTHPVFCSIGRCVNLRRRKLDYLPPHPFTPQSDRNKIDLENKITDKYTRVEHAGGAKEHSGGAKEPRSIVI